MYLLINVNEIKFVHKADKRIPIICSFPGLAAMLIEWIQGYIPVTCNDYFEVFVCDMSCSPNMQIKLS